MPSACAVGQITCSFGASRLDEEGRIAIVTKCEAGCGGRGCIDDERYERGRRSRVVLARPCRRQVRRRCIWCIARATVANAGSPGRVRS